MMNRFTSGILLMGIFMLTSCITSKKVIIVKDLKADTSYRVMNLPPLLMQKSDRISIIVSARRPELAVPFNSPAGSYIINTGGNVSADGDQEHLAANNTIGYLVDREGNINFPVLGNLHVEGLSIEQLRDLVSGRLQQGNYIDKPVVKVELLNLKINMMGEVTKVGLLEVPDSRITLLEAISRSGGLTVNGLPGNVTVIREENGRRQRIETDIESAKVFESPAYYLKQNDIVYVLPKAAPRSFGEQRTWQYVATGLGGATLIFSLLTLFNK